MRCWPYFLGLIFLLASLSLNRGLGLYRGLASSWSHIPSRSLSGLHYVFKNFEYLDQEGIVRVSGPVVELTGGTKRDFKIYPLGFMAEMDLEDFEEEQLLAQSVFQARSGDGKNLGTAFLVGRDLVLTNRHLLGIKAYDKSWPCGQFKIVLNHRQEELNCEFVKFCSQKFDYCVVQVERLKNGLQLGSELRPLRLARWPRSGPDIKLFHIGNAAGLGLQASSGVGVRIEKGEFHHFVPTLKGSSGAPLFDDKGQVVGINWGHTGDGLTDEKSFNRGVLSSTIFSELKTQPLILKDIKSFRSWFTKDKKHLKAKIDSQNNIRQK